MLLECGILHGGVGALCTAEPHRRHGGVRAQHVRPELEVGDAREVALVALYVLLQVCSVHPLPVHVGHVLYETTSEGRRKITEHTLKNIFPSFPNLQLSAFPPYPMYAFTTYVLLSVELQADFAPELLDTMAALKKSRETRCKFQGKNS